MLRSCRIPPAAPFLRPRLHCKCSFTRFSLSKFRVSAILYVNCISATNILGMCNKPEIPPIFLRPQSANTAQILICWRLIGVANCAFLRGFIDTNGWDSLRLRHSQINPDCVKTSRLVVLVLTRFLVS